MAGKAQVGTAGWSIPREVAGAFPSEGSLLSRYAIRFGAVEVNSTFYRSHRPSTYKRWLDSTPEDFRFAVKLPRAITHDLRLRKAKKLLSIFLEEVSALEQKLGPILVQLPPALPFEARTAGAFFKGLRSLHFGSAACEPRHKSWFTPEANKFLADWKIARVAADPARAPEGHRPGGALDLVYYRLHGSPRTYYSSYESTYLEGQAAQLRATTAEAWCIFDNTASGAACRNALELSSLVE